MYKIECIKSNPSKAENVKNRRILDNYFLPRINRENVV